MRQLIKKLFLFFGFQISRAKQSEPDEARKWTWLSKFTINSIVDIGANEGQFAKKILKIFPNAKLHCFEPLQDVFEKLKLNLSNRTDVYFYNVGLGERDEEQKIFNNEYSPSSSLLEMSDLHKKNFDYAVRVEPKSIQIRKLDNFISDVRPDRLLIKVDVQGYEMHVINGGGKMIALADIIIIETSFQQLYKDQPLFGDIYDYFTNHGFYFAGNIEQLLSPVDMQILQADAVFIKSVGHNS